jgi:cytochrome c oxidase cbb3-type subunit III
MADLPSAFWGGWIVVLTLVSFCGLAWLVLSVYFAPDHESGEEAVWDEDLREGQTPAPLWWFWMILAFMVFSVIYLLLYPGMGRFKGMLRWSQGHHIEASYESYDAEFGPQRQRLAALRLEDIQADPGLMDTARNIFVRECAACHGSEGLGQANMFPNLRDDHWQWGAEATQVEQSIRQGRLAVMPAWGAALGNNLDNVTDYVMALAAGTAGEQHPGYQSYQLFCVACHGAEGQGNPLLGAPDLRAGVWIYGGDRDSLRLTIEAGRGGVMPAFQNRLDDFQVRLLTAWLTETQID